MAVGHSERSDVGGNSLFALALGGKCPWSILLSLFIIVEWNKTFTEVEKIVLSNSCSHYPCWKKKCLILECHPKTHVLHGRQGGIIRSGEILKEWDLGGYPEVTGRPLYRGIIEPQPSSHSPPWNHEVSSCIPYTLPLPSRFSLETWKPWVCLIRPPQTVSQRRPSLAINWNILCIVIVREC